MPPCTNKMKQRQTKAYRLCFAGAAIWLALTSCATKEGRSEDSIKPPQILAWGTEEYNAKVKGLKLAPSEARVRLIAMRKQQGRSGFGQHFVLVNDDYVFGYTKLKINDIPLSGYYVNGMTGEIAEQQGRGKLDETQQKALWGKVIKPCPLK